MFSQGTFRLFGRTNFCFLALLVLCVLIVSTSCHLSLSTQSTAKKEVAKVRTPTPAQLREPDEELQARTYINGLSSSPLSRRVNHRERQPPASQ